MTPNRLSRSLSPYLLQHSHNPVDWYEWSPQSLELARELDRPIFLSVGYSACHWCHVMAHESFENEQIAAVMNELFVNIKVDREERPDVDEIYMTAVQLLNRGQGGWPMSVWLTPDLRPFAAGTYLPPTSRNPYGRTGFIDVCQKIGELWRSKREALEDDAARVAQAIAEIWESRRVDPQMASSAAAPVMLTTAEAAVAPTDVDQLLTSAGGRLIESLDRVHGGFGSAPKFPPSMAIDLLLRLSQRTGRTEFCKAADLTLHKMAMGGMYDQIGGGFARYSVDDRWLVPHFEKMLYDNALLTEAYISGYQMAILRGREDDAAFYRRVACETVDYVLRDLRLPEGGIACAEDADSEGHEGKFYLWTPGQIEAVLGAAAAAQVCAVFDVTAQGNFEDGDGSILNLRVPIEEAARLNGFDGQAFVDQWPQWRQALLLARSERIRPGRDDKVLTAWNGMFIHALCRAGECFGKPAYIAAAKQAADFVLEHLQRDGKLLRTWRCGEARLPAFQDDYACMIDALVSLFEATSHRAALDDADRLAGQMLTSFGDPATGLLFYTPHDHEQLIVRTHSTDDGATPSGNATAARALLRLSALLDRPAYAQAASGILHALKMAAKERSPAHHRLLSVLDWQERLTQVVVVLPTTGLSQGADPLVEQAWRAALGRAYLPQRVSVICDQNQARAWQDMPILQGRSEHSPRGYVCRGQTCSAPLTAPEQLAALLAKS